MAVSLGGFDTEAKQLVRAAEELGWVFRISANNHAIGRAPDGKTTMSIPQRLSRANRSMQNAHATFRRWLREQPDAQSIRDMETIQAAYVGSEPDPILDGVMERGMNKKSKQAISTVRHVVEEGPWGATRAVTHLGAMKYDSVAVIERLWSDGTTDYLCGEEGCGWTSGNPRSVAAHYGKTHSRGKGTQPKPPVSIIDPDVTEPGYHRAYQPLPATLDSLVAFLEQAPVKITDLRDMAHLMLTWAHERRDSVREGEPEVAVQPVVVESESQRTLDAIRSLLGDSGVEAERDQWKAEAQALAGSLARVESDLQAVRDMLGQVGRNGKVGGG